MYFGPDTKLLLHLLDQSGTQPKWMYHNTKELKALTKEGYIAFDKSALSITLTPKGQEWVKEHPFPKSIDLARWIEEHAFCKGQTLIRQDKCTRLIKFLVGRNQIYRLFDLFKLVRERKKKIWNNRLVVINLKEYIITNAIGDGPFSLRFDAIMLERGMTVKLNTMANQVTTVGEYLSPEKVAMLKRIYEGPQ